MSPDYKAHEYLDLRRKEFLQETGGEGSLCIVWIDEKRQGNDRVSISWSVSFPHSIAPLCKIRVAISEK